MKGIRIPYVSNKLTTRKSRNKINHRATMLVLFILANVAVSFGRAGVTLKNNGNLITVPDDFDLNRLSGLLSSESGEIYENAGAVLPHSNSNQNQNKMSIVVNAKKSNTETTRNTNNFPVDFDDMVFGEVINLIKKQSGNNGDSDLKSILELLLVKLNSALLRGGVSTTSTTPVPTTTTTTTSTSTPVDKITVFKLKLKKYLKTFEHSHHVGNLKKMLGLHAEEGEEEKEKNLGKIESKTKPMFQANKFNSKNKSDLVPLSKPEFELPVPVPVSGFVNKPQARKLGINIPVFRVKVDDRVLFEGKAEVKVFVDGLESASWALVIFTVLLLIAILLGCVFGVRYLRKLENMQYQDFQHQTQNELKELKTRGCSNHSVSVRGCERHPQRLPPTCRCGYDDDLTKTHIADIIRGDFDLDSGTSSHMGSSSIV